MTNIKKQEGNIQATVIIPTLNRSEQLSRTLNSLGEIDFPSTNFEIIIVDNGSTDNTPQVIREFNEANKQLNIKCFNEPIPGLLSGRHKGALEAKSDILIFIDDDIRVDKGWLQAIVSAFNSNPSVKLIGGRNLPLYEADPPDWLEYFWIKNPEGKSCGELSLLDFGNEPMEIDPENVWGLNYSIRKKTLFELGGFHPDCIPSEIQYLQGDGETGLSNKIKKEGYKALYVPKALVYHEVSIARMSYEYFDKRFFYLGICLSYSHLRNDQKGGLEHIKSMQSKAIKWPLGAEVIVARKIILNNFKLVTPDGLSLIKLFREFKLKRRFFQQLIKGYKYHQGWVKKYPALMQWIKKEDYWDYKLPDILNMK